MHIEAKERAMAIEVTWIHHASFRMEHAGTVLYIDPWKLELAPHDADLIFVSHSHYDHCSPEDIEKASNAGTVIVAPAETIEKLGASNAVAPGESLTVQGITIEAVAAYNVGKTFHPRANNWCGAVFTLDGKRIYYAGDTDLVPEMSDLKDIDLALLPVGGAYTLDAAQAAEACKRIGCRHAVPYHWGDIVGSETDARMFADAAACQTTVLHPGERMTV